MMNKILFPNDLSFLKFKSLKTPNLLGGRGHQIAGFFDLQYPNAMMDHVMF